MTLKILIALMMSAFREARSDESLMVSLLVLIHRSAWKGVSANFALTEFSEVHIEHRTQRAPNSHPRLATSAADGPLHSRRPPKERTDLCERSRQARLVMNVATLLAPSRCFRTPCAPRHRHWCPDM